MSEWKLVPVDPTDEMVRAGYHARFEQASTNRIYAAMLAAAPAVSAEPVAYDAPALTCYSDEYGEGIEDDCPHLLAESMPDVDHEFELTLWARVADITFQAVENADPEACNYQAKEVSRVSYAPPAEWSRPPAPAVAWQPIDTAPKDGTQVIVTGLMYEKGPERWIAVAQYSACRWCDEYGTEIYPPTHWIPLPPNGGV